MNNGAEELAKILNNFKNPPDYSPVYGTVTELPNLKIRCGAKIVLTARHIKSLVDLYKRDFDGNYIHLNKQVAMLPYNNNNNYLVLGVIQDG